MLSVIIIFIGTVLFPRRQMRPDTASAFRVTLCCTGRSVWNEIWSQICQVGSILITFSDNYRHSSQTYLAIPPPLHPTLPHPLSSIYTYMGTVVRIDPMALTMLAKCSTSELQATDYLFFKTSSGVN